jgi:hypothetical protein
VRDVPEVPDCAPEGPEIVTASLMTSVGAELTSKKPAIFVAVTVTRMNWFTCELVGTYVADVAPEIVVHEAKSVALVQDFH